MFNKNKKEKAKKTMRIVSTKDSTKFIELKIEDAERKIKAQIEKGTPNSDSVGVHGSLNELDDIIEDIDKRNELTEAQLKSLARRYGDLDID